MRCAAGEVYCWWGVRCAAGEVCCWCGVGGWYGWMEVVDIQSLVIISRVSYRGGGGGETWDSPKDFPPDRAA